MDTSLLNVKLLEEKLSGIRQSSSRLKALAELDRALFVSNLDNFAIAEHHLRRSLEMVLDIGRHIIAKMGWGAPADYRGILVTLGQRGVLPLAFVTKIKGMAGYRNRLVHGYADITEEEIHELLTLYLPDFAEFCRYILIFLEALPKKES